MPLFKFHADDNITVYIYRMKFTHLDIFTGIGGFTKMLDGVSRPVAYCDIDEHSRKVLLKNMRRGKLPIAPIVEDVKDLSAFVRKSAKSIDIVSASTPCTGHSLAGKRQGFGHEDSALFRYIYDVVDAARPSVVFMENTPFISNELTSIISGFCHRGYNVAWAVLPAYAVGSPQSRKRWFCVCWDDLEKYTQIMQSLYASENKFSWRRERGPRNVEEKGVGHHARLKLLGNAIVPQCARAAFIYVFQQLSTANLKATKETPSDGFVTEHGSMFVIPGVRIVKPNKHLVFKGNGVSLTKQLWPTPRAKKTGSCVSLSDRCSRDLATALRFEINSPPGYSNPRWVEWLMGYPSDWTRL